MKQVILHTSAEPLIAYFEKSFQLTDGEKELVMAKFHSRLFRKKQYVLQEWNICTHMNFVVRGCLRSYKVDERGNTYILQFASEDNWINDLGSFHSMKPTALNIDALEDTVVLQITYDDLIYLYKHVPKFNLIFRVLVENAYIRLQERILQNISSTAEERYLSFLELYPHLSNRLSQVQIAAFLGVTPEFLSKLRNIRTKTSKAQKP